MFVFLVFFFFNQTFLSVKSCYTPLTIITPHCSSSHLPSIIPLQSKKKISSNSVNNSDSIHISIGGLKSRKLVNVAAVFPDPTFFPHTFPQSATIFTIQLTEILMVLSRILLLNSVRCYIHFEFAYFLADLYRRNQITFTVQTFWECSTPVRKLVIYRWRPSHVDITGNKNADKVDKFSLLSADYSTNFPLSVTTFHHSITLFIPTKDIKTTGRGACQVIRER